MPAGVGAEAALREAALVERQPLGNARQGHTRDENRRAEPAAFANRSRGRDRAPDRRVRSLSRARAKLRQAELIELAVVTQRRLGPRAEHDLERLGRPLAAVVAAQAIADELVLVEVGPVPDADVDP